MGARIEGRVSTILHDQSETRGGQHQQIAARLSPPRTDVVDTLAARARVGLSIAQGDGK